MCRRDSHARSISKVRITRFDASPDDDEISAALDRPPPERTEGRRAHGVPATEVETRVVPGAAERVSHDEAVGEGRAVMRARRAHGEEFVPRTGEENSAVTNMTGERRAIGQRLAAHPLR
jgi:hypothetical protein